MSSSDEQTLTVDPLFVAMTRPATVLGVPYVAFVAEIVVSAMVFLAIGNPLWIAIVFPIHGILYLISVNDPSIFFSIAMWVKTNGKCLNTAYWGAASFSPLPVKKR